MSNQTQMMQITASKPYLNQARNSLIKSKVASQANFHERFKINNGLYKLA
jgi:hypothetical protein